MDMSKVSQGQMVAGVGGILLVVSLFLDWISGVTVTVGGTSVSAGGGNAFDVFSGMDIIMLIVAVIAIGWAVAAGMGAGATLPSYTGWLVGLLGVALIGWSLGWDLEDGNAGIGSWLALIASAAIAWGGVGASSRPAIASTAPTTPATPPPSTPAV